MPEPGTKPTPCIKGIFVKSHVLAVEREHGREGVEALEQSLGRSVSYRNNDLVPIRQEVALLECAVKLFSPQPVAKELVSFEAGRLHFRNFSKTPFGRILLFTFGHDFRRIMLNAKYVAGHIFRGIVFESQEVGPGSIRLVMRNADYPVDHFRGLLYEWLHYSGLHGTVQGEMLEPNTHVYTLRWSMRGAEVRALHA